MWIEIRTRYVKTATLKLVQKRLSATKKRMAPNAAIILRCDHVPLRDLVIFHTSYFRPANSASSSPWRTRFQPNVIVKNRNTEGFKMHCAVCEEEKGTGCNSRYYI